MTFYERYSAAYETSGTRLCIGLDTSSSMIPTELLSHANPIAAFNRMVIEATADLCSAYKMNLAFYESEGTLGIDALHQTLAAIPEGIVSIGDAKRGDIGNTAERYAQAMFEGFGFDAATVNPYMGTDTMKPWFDYPGHGVFVLGRTSNPGSAEFQSLDTGDGIPLYMRVIARTLEVYGDTGSVGFVVGATHPAELAEVRATLGGEIPLLIPGLGSQGGDAEATVAANNHGRAWFNVSRAIINPSADHREEDTPRAIRRAAEAFRDGLSEIPSDQGAPSSVRSWS